MRSGAGSVLMNDNSSESFSTLPVPLLFDLQLVSKIVPWGYRALVKRFTFQFAAHNTAYTILDEPTTQDDFPPQRFAPLVK